MFNARKVVETIAFHLFLKHSYHRVNAVRVFRSTSLVVSDTNNANRPTDRQDCSQQFISGGGGVPSRTFRPSLSFRFPLPSFPLCLFPPPRSGPSNLAKGFGGALLAVAALHQSAPGQMTWLEDSPPWLRPGSALAPPCPLAACNFEGDS